MMAAIYLKPGREKALLRRHPWVFSGALARLEGEPEMGETVCVKAADGTVLGVAAYSPQSSIRARMWSFGQDENVDMQQLLNDKLRIAIIHRARIFSVNSANNAIRLVHGESDGLPGLIVDRYGDWLVAQFLSAGVERYKADIVADLRELTGLENVYERSDVDVRALEGLAEVKGLLSGAQPPEMFEINENGLRFWVDIQNGHKTGFYLDQRDNRREVQRYAQDRLVLNCFSYTGAFSVNCLAGGASKVISIDSSQDVLELGKRNLELNGLPAEKAEWRCADVFQELRLQRDRRERFDLIILDPPKFAPTSAHLDSAARGYKDINLLAFKLLNPGGILATFSCSGGVDRALFQKIVAGAAFDAGVDARILEQLSQAADHPVALTFPEGEYLKGLICQVSDKKENASEGTE